MEVLQDRRVCLPADRIPVDIFTIKVNDLLEKVRLIATEDIKDRGEGLVLDTGPFTDEEQPYQVRKAKSVTAKTNYKPPLLGKFAIACCFPRPCIITSSIWWMVVVLIETVWVAFILLDVRRFCQKRVPAISSEPEMHNTIPPSEAVLQWCWGDLPYGHWKNYHPHICTQLEKELATDEGFMKCKVSVRIDEVRYNLQRLSVAKPFEYVEESHVQGFPEPFLLSDCGHFDYVDCATCNCFVQSQTRHPRRRRPVRRVRLSGTVGLELGEEPCNVCFSDAGCLAGCRRAGLQIIFGDVMQTDHLLCGCLTLNKATELEGPLHKADAIRWALIRKPHDNPMAHIEFDMEVLQDRHACPLADGIPGDIFTIELDDWLERARLISTEHLHHVCLHPGCGIENWILQADFDNKYRSDSCYIWFCRKGHTNSVLPVQEDINEMKQQVGTMSEEIPSRQEKHPEGMREVAALLVISQIITFMHNMDCTAAVTVCSCPAELLDCVKALRQQFEIDVVAGERNDVQHRSVLKKATSLFGKLAAKLNAISLGEPSWLNLWRIKVAERIENIDAQRPGRPHVLVCIPGGPACDLERREFHGDGFVPKVYADKTLYLKICTHAEDLRHFLDRKRPLAECLRIA